MNRFWQLKWPEDLRRRKSRQHRKPGKDKLQWLFSCGKAQFCLCFTFFPCPLPFFLHLHPNSELKGKKSEEVKKGPSTQPQTTSPSVPGASELLKSLERKGQVCPYNCSAKHQSSKSFRYREIIQQDVGLAEWGFYWYLTEHPNADFPFVGKP